MASTPHIRQSFKTVQATKKTVKAAFAKIQKLALLGEAGGGAFPRDASEHTLRDAVQPPPSR